MNKNKQFYGKCLDTNVLIKLEKNDQELEKLCLLNKTEKLFFPIICQAELFTGYNKYQEEEQYKLWNNIKEILQLNIININEESVKFYAKIFWRLKTMGKKITQNDLWILSIVLQNNLELLTYDQHLKNCWKSLLNLNLFSY